MTDRPKNQVSMAEARRMAEGEKMHWLEWEKRVDGLLRCNGWDSWKDRVMPKKFGAEAQRVGRKKGLPDRLVRKVFAGFSDVPPLLRPMLGIASWDGKLAVVGVIECKTGAATTTPEQEKWLEAFRLLPGGFGMVVRPKDYRWLVERLGGEFPT